MSTKEQQMYSLLNDFELSYTTAVGANSPTRTHTSENHKAYSRFIVNVAFFVPVFLTSKKSRLLWALCRAESTSVVEGSHLCGTEQSVDCSVNSVHRPPYSIHTDKLGYNNLTTKVLIMENDTQKKQWVSTPEDCLTINASRIDTTQLQDPLFATLARALATLALLQADGADLSHGFTLQHKIIMDALWAIEGQLNQLHQLLEAGTTVPCSVGGAV